MKVTVCEMRDDRDGFEADWKGLARHVKRESSDLVLLPEMPFYHWFCAAPKFDRGTWEDAVEEHARWIGKVGDLGAPMVLGTRPVQKGVKRLNQGFVWGSSGTRGVHYKRYLPDEPGYYEARWYGRGGRKFVPFEASGWRMGFMICSDLWSMSNARMYGKRGVAMVAVPRSTGKESLDRWLAAGKVAAILSGAYCLSSNRSGRRGEAEFGGGGWILGPDAEVLGLTTEDSPFVTAEVEKSRTVAAKKTYPRSSLEPD